MDMTDKPREADLIERMALANWGKEEYFPLGWQEGMTAVLDAIRETHAIVPREPTETMLSAGIDVICSHTVHDDAEITAWATFRAMLKAGEAII